ncbi:MAG: ATP-binding protein [Eubacteriales bacterium]|nr:ATP-binding protein [Eubacteriales bacterium]
MKQKILNHGSFLVVLSVLLTFFAASFVMYDKFNVSMKQGVRDEAEYVKTGMEAFGENYLTKEVGDLTETRITLADADGKVLFDSEKDPEMLENHSNRPEFIQAAKEGYGELVRFSDTFSKQTFYCALRLDDGKILRVARTTDSVFHTMMSGFTLLGILMIGILLLDFFLVQKQTNDLIAPINALDLEHPLREVCYEELRPLLVRVDQQNEQIARQIEELKEAEAMRREFSANVSHELKTPLMSISGYAELMMNGMVPEDKVPEFSGRIYHEAGRLSSLVADIIQLSRLEEKGSELDFAPVDIYDLAQEVASHLQASAEKKKISISVEGEPEQVEGMSQVLYEVFYNVADNAVRYTEEGGTVRISVGKKKGHPYYRVEDNGIGIPENEQKRVFERFYRVDKSHSRETGGTGLGLSIVKHGAAMHHADLQLKSAPGNGTLIELVFQANSNESNVRKNREKSF